MVVRVLAYDSNLTAMVSKKTVIVAIAYRPGDGGACARMVRASVGEATFSGKPVQFVASPYTNTDAFESTVVSAGAAAIYVCTGLDDAVRAIATVSRRNSMLTLCTGESYVRAGLSIGLAVRDERPRLFVNLPAVRAEGAHLAPALLKVAEVLQ